MTSGLIADAGTAHGYGDLGLEWCGAVSAYVSKAAHHRTSDEATLRAKAERWAAVWMRRTIDGNQRER